jgi:hypothetical protein
LAIQAHSTPFKGFRGKIFLFYGPDGSHGQPGTGECSKASQTVPRCSKAFFQKKRLFIFFERSAGRDGELTPDSQINPNANQKPAKANRKTFESLGKPATTKETCQSAEIEQHEEKSKLVAAKIQTS